MDQENVVPQKIKDIFKQTKLWQQLQKEKDLAKIQCVDELVSFAQPILGKINETFPTYTLHNEQHQLNVLNLMADLLGDKIVNLTSLETAILILSAFFHDIGMAFTITDKENIRMEEDFEEFLNQNPSARLTLATNIEMSIDIIEWYCRWAHAKRVWIYIKKVQNSTYWENVNFKKELAEVCLSHNEDVSYLKDDKKFEINFWGQADLRFCALILRLADILDFDNSRSPQSVFDYLKLDDPQTNREKNSYNEWKKHLDSKGFTFNEWNASKPYPIDFKATPTHPAVENDIREFLKIIEFELQKCSVMLNMCSQRWQDFSFPDSIIKNNIRSQGYKYGNYKFTLDQDQILNLLMGENLYDDHYVFIRELIQNAIDTSRDREFHERNNHNPQFQAKPVEISTWIDNDGYRWLRLDDYGMGMTEDIINNYFLKVGNSYYNSYEFKVRKLLYNALEGKDFTHISRFGIGVLSCFIAGDRIELNTKSVSSDGHLIFPIRLSLKGLHNFYVLQTGVESPAPMPHETEDEKDYRKEAGTSIAVRFRADRDPIDFNLEKILRKNLLNPPVKIHYNNVGFIGDYSAITNNKWCKTTLVSLDDDDIRLIERTFNVKLRSRINISIHSVDLTLSSVNENLSGQIIIIHMPIPKIEFNQAVFDEEEYDGFYEDDWSPIEFNFSYPGIKQVLGKRKKEYFLEVSETKNKDNKKTLDFNLARLIDNILIKDSELFDNFEFEDLILSHIGIGIPNIKDIFSFSNLSNNSIDIYISGPDAKDVTAVIGLVELKDVLRPTLSISRNKIVKLDWMILSQLNYNIYIALKSIKKFSNIRNIDTISTDCINLRASLKTTFALQVHN